MLDKVDREIPLVNTFTRGKKLRALVKGAFTRGQDLSALVKGADLTTSLF